MTNLFPLISLLSIFQAEVRMGKLLSGSSGEGKCGGAERQLPVLTAVVFKKHKWKGRENADKDAHPSEVPFLQHHVKGPLLAGRQLSNGWWVCFMLISVSHRKVHTLH